MSRRPPGRRGGGGRGPKIRGGGGRGGSKNSGCALLLIYVGAGLVLTSGLAGLALALVTQ